MATPKAGGKPAPRKQKPAEAKTKGAAGIGASEKKAAPKKLGAPGIYTPELAAQICAHIADAKTLRQIQEIPGMPAMATIMKWLDGSKPDFSEQYARAREAQADKLAEDIISIADEECTFIKASKHNSSDDDGEGNTEVAFDPTAVARNRLRVDARKWLASKMAPKKYGDKLTQEHTGPGGAALQVASTVTFVRPPARAED